MHPQEERFYTAVTIAAIVMGIIIAYFIISLIRHQRRNLALYKAKIRAEISTLENERRRIASDLHDELGPLLSAVRMHINHIGSQSDQDKSIVMFANKHIDDILHRTREISYNLLPNTLIRKGLTKAIEEYINKLYNVHELQIVFKADMFSRLNREKEINIYRIVQEITHNTIKHASAKRLIIHLKTQNDKLILMTADDGSGFNIDERMTNGNGLGLINLQSRADVLDARFNYASETDKGTKYIFEIPLTETI